MRERTPESTEVVASGQGRGDSSNLGGPSVRYVRSSYLDEQYPVLAEINRLRASHLERMREEAFAFRHKPLFSVLVPVLGPGREEWLGRTLDSVLGQAYPYWELRVCCGGSGRERLKELLSRYERLDERIRLTYLERNTSMPGLSDAALSLATGEFTCLLGEGDELSQDALFEVAKLLQEHPSADLIYSDEDSIDGEGNRFGPRFKPDWSPDLLLSADYVSRLSVYRRGLLEELGGFGEGFGGAEDYDLVLRATERTEKIHHIPKVLYHRRTAADSLVPSGGSEGRTRAASRRALSEALGRRGIEGSVEGGNLPGTFRVRRKIVGEPKVSIIMPTKDHAHLLKSCIESIERLTTYRNYEILIIDNDSTEPATLEYLAKTPHRVIPFREEYNYSRINNLGVSQSKGEYVLLLNDDTEVISGEWLEAMLEHAQRPEVGAVGAKLIYPDGRVQHAGVVTGVGHSWMRGVATHAYQFYPSDASGHMGTLATTTNYNAVTAACMMVRKGVYEEVGGLDENLRVSFDDVDLCLRIRERGYLVVYTPHAELYHHETMTRKKVDTPAEVLYMRERWEGKLDADPYYNPHFSRGLGDFNLRADLLRPRVLRRGPGREDPTTELKSQRLMSPEEFDEYLQFQRRAARDSVRFAIVPRESAGIVETTLLEILDRKILENENALLPQKDERDPFGSCRSS
jgi:GT2 family glycosyltransferase